MAAPKKNVAFTVDLPVFLGGVLVVNPPVAAGDFKVSTDESAFANNTTLPSVAPAAGTNLTIPLSAGEMNGDRIVIQASDQTVPKAWDDFTVTIYPTLATIDDVAGFVDTEIAALQTDLTTVLSRLSAARAGYLDKLNITGNVAGSAEVTAIQNNTRVVIAVPEVIERPDAGTVTYIVHLYLYDDVGNMEAPDAAPVAALTNQAGTDLSARLGSVNGTLVNAGHYKWVYTASVGDALEQLLWEFSIVEGGLTRLLGRQSLLVDTTAVDFTAADRTKLDTLHDVRLTAARAGYLDFLADATVGLTNLKALLDAIGAKTVNLPASPAATGAAMTLTVGERGDVADKILNRNIRGGSDAGRRVYEAMAFMRNKWTIVAGVLTVYDVDDTTVLFTAAVGTTAGNPISSLDPA